MNQLPLILKNTNKKTIGVNLRVLILQKLNSNYKMKVSVIGAGTMGNGIAHTFAQFNYNVQLIDVSQLALEKGIATISKNLDRMVAKEKISG